MLTLYAFYLIASIGFTGLLVLRVIGTQKYKQFFDKYLWSVDEE